MEVYFGGFWQENGIAVVLLYFEKRKDLLHPNVSVPVSPYHRLMYFFKKFDAFFLGANFFFFFNSFNLIHPLFWVSTFLLKAILTLLIL